MNHSGLTISKAARPNQYTWKMPSATAATAPHTASRASEGTSRRRIRLSTKLPPEPRSLDQSCRWAYPPTKKNTGMTCSSLVRIHRLRVKLRGLSADGPVLCQTTMVNTQCHSTTTSRLNARHRSMNSSCIEPGAMRSALPGSCAERAFTAVLPGSEADRLGLP
jgi:hypothetical protein